MQAVPVEAGRLVAKGIVDMDHEPVAQVDVNSWTWPLAIDANHRPREAIRTCSHPGDVPVIGDSF